MSELYRTLKRRSAKAEFTNDDIIVYEKINPQHFHPKYDLVSDKFEIGLEIEVEKLEHNNIHQYLVWAIKADGSLRDNGAEYISVPMCGPRIGFALNQFYSLLPQSARFSPRTSIHVHLNMLDATPHETASLVIAYCAVEKLLYQFVGYDRDKNNFCVPFYTTDSYTSYLGQLKQNSWSNFVGNDGLRYSGLNLASLVKFGTLEFRQLHGTKDVTKIINWINLIFCLKQVSKTISFLEMEEKINRLNTTSEYQSFVETIFPTHYRLLDLSNVRNDMETIVGRLKKLSINPKLIAELKKNVPTSFWFNQLLNQKTNTKSSMKLTFPRAPVPRRARNDQRRPNVRPAPIQQNQIFGRFDRFEEQDIVRYVVDADHLQDGAERVLDLQIEDNLIGNPVGENP